jgi:hypothetical protein
MYIHKNAGILENIYEFEHRSHIISCSNWVINHLRKANSMNAHRNNLNELYKLNVSYMSKKPKIIFF